MGTSFVNDARATVPAEFVPGIEEGLRIASEEGLRAGFPLIDFKATLVDGAYHDVDSSIGAFRMAAQGAFRELTEKGDVRLAEPVMSVKVEAPEEFIHVIIGDLNSRCAVIESQRVEGGAAMLSATVPLANMFGYADALGAISQNRARQTARFDHYQPVTLPDDDPPFPPAIGMRA
jgi:elongation factor G